MSYLSTLPEEIREKKEKQLKIVLNLKPELFRNLNMKMRNMLLENRQRKIEKLPLERREVYEKLYNRLNPSIQIIDVNSIMDGLKIPNNNKLFFLSLFNNDLGENHYAYAYLDLILNHEVKGEIIPGYTNLLETSSGSGGISCSKIAKELGYKCTIAIPSGGEKVREKAIIDNDAELILTDENKYVAGFPEFIKDYIRKNLQDFRNKKVFFLSHMQGSKNKSGKYENNNETIIALSNIAYKILQECKEKGINLDYIISGIGNGTNTLGIGGPLNLHGIKIIGFEPFESGIAYEKLYPGKYEKNFGIKPGELGRHDMPGLSHKVDFDIPHLDNSIDIIEDIYLIGNHKTLEKYTEKIGSEIPEDILYYDNKTYDLSELGRTSKAGFYTAMELAKKIKNKNILFLGYDKGNRYDDYDILKKDKASDIGFKINNIPNKQMNSYYKIESKDWTNKTFDGINIKENPEGDIIEITEGKFKGIQMFKYNAMIKETKKRNMANTGEELEAILNEKFKGNLISFINEKNLILCGGYDSEKNKFFYMGEEFILWNKDGSYFYGNNNKYSSKKHSKYKSIFLPIHLKQKI